MIAQASGATQILYIVPLTLLASLTAKLSLLSPEHLLKWLKLAGTPSTHYHGNGTRRDHADTLWAVLTWIQTDRHSSYTVNVSTS